MNMYTQKNLVANNEKMLLHIAFERILLNMYF
jgi:hypothetical protein